MARVAYVDASKTYPGSNRRAVDTLRLEARDGEFLVILGPSGCGKTTALRMLAGLEGLDDGRVMIDDEEVTHMPPGDRGVAMVFQHYALYPHLSVADNLGFRLKVTGMPQSGINRRVRRVAGALNITPLLERYPRTLSSGEQQRVGMGRAMIREPKVYLMDEPLGALDAKLRASVRLEILERHHAHQTTTIYVTHDQVEAMAMGDRIAVMSDGVLQQCAEPRELYDRPANEFVAGFIGSPPMNLVQGRYDRGWAVIGDVDVVEIPCGRALGMMLTSDAVTVGFRPEHVGFAAVGEGVYAQVEAVEELGYTSYAYCAVGVGENRRTIIVRCPAHGAPAPGTAVGLRPDPGHVRYFDSLTTRRVDIP